MAVLTALAPDPYHPGYHVVEVDRGRFTSLPDELLASLELTVGQPVAAATLERLHTLADTEAAYRAGVRMLALRAHSRADLLRRLKLRQHPPAAADQAVAMLTERGLLDDRVFAERYAAVRARRGVGPLRLLRDLGAQGVERHVAEAAVRDGLAAEEIDVYDEARRFASRRLGALGSLPLVERRRRLASYLQRRGYAAADALLVARDLCPNY
jgi:regulatory protein